MLKFAATLVMFVGMGVCGFSLWLSCLGLVEGVSLWAGEGQRLQPESSEALRRRLTIIGGLTASGVCGWVLARLGTHFRRADSGPWRRRLLLVTAEFLLFLGGVFVAMSALIFAASFQAEQCVPRVYYVIATVAIVAAPFLLPAGVALHRRAGLTQIG